MGRRHVTGAFIAALCTDTVAGLIMNAQILPLWVWAMGIAVGLGMMMPTRWLRAILRLVTTAGIRNEARRWGDAVRENWAWIKPVVTSRGYWVLLVGVLLLVVGIPALARFLFESPQ